MAAAWLNSCGVQVKDYTLNDLQGMPWPDSQTMLTAQQALAATAPYVKLVVLDVKTSIEDTVCNTWFI